MTTIKSPQKFLIQISKRVRFSDLDWRLLLLILPALSLLLFLSVPSSSTTTTTTFFNPFYYIAPLKSLVYKQLPPPPPHSPSPAPSPSPSPPPTNTPLPCHSTDTPPQFNVTERKRELDRSKIAVCLVGGARRFELTGPSIVENILKVYPNADLFLHSPLDSNAYKFSLLKAAPKIAVIRVFEPKHVQETESQLRVLTAQNSPNGIQGLLQYFTLVEGCLSMITAYQEGNNFTYDWVVRTRVDGYWSASLGPEYFIPGHYLVPTGSSYGGLNDRFGVGDLNQSKVALSRLSLITQLDSAGFLQLNSEGAFKAQLTTQGVPCMTKRIPFCVMSDRRYGFPPGRNGVPVAALSSRGPLSGAKCRPCTSACNGGCVGQVMNAVDRSWGWTDWGNRTVELCDARGEWEDGWEEIFDRAGGKKLGAARKQVSGLKLEQCVRDFQEMKEGAYLWDAPPPSEICSRGLSSR